LNENSENSYELKLNGSSLEILGTLKFDETWPTAPFYEKKINFQ
jgi:hypothetical protein